MNRVRRLGNVFQVLITPSIKVSPDSSLMVGNWEDSELRNFYILEFPTVSDALCEAMNHPDIDWYRLIINHTHIFKRLDNTIKSVMQDQGFSTEYHPQLMTPEMLKSTMFDRVMKNGDRYNLRYGANDIISFTIINPWSSNLHKIARALESHRVHPYRDDLRIRERNITNGNVISLLGYTEFGTVYEIRLVPTLIYQWEEWFRKFGFMKPQQAEQTLKEIIKKQSEVDKFVLR